MAYQGKHISMGKGDLSVTTLFLIQHWFDCLLPTLHSASGLDIPSEDQSGLRTLKATQQVTSNPPEKAPTSFSRPGIIPRGAQERAGGTKLNYIIGKQPLKIFTGSSYLFSSHAHEYFWSWSHPRCFLHSTACRHK